jgi:hypothetical protein
MNEEERSKILPLRKQIAEVLTSAELLQMQNPSMKILELILDSLDQAYYISVFGKLPERSKHD